MKEGNGCGDVRVFTRRSALKTAALIAGASVVGGAIGGCAPKDQSISSGGSTVNGVVKPIEGARAGTYVGTAFGVGGPLSVEATVDETGFVDRIAVYQNYETKGFADLAIDAAVSNVLLGQTLDIDAFSGATRSLTAFKDALSAALSQAGVAEAFAGAPAYTRALQPIEDLNADVVVVGGGVAGATCALMAARGGLDVVLVERMGFLGGSMLRSDGLWLVAGGMDAPLRAGGVAWKPYYDQTTPVSMRQNIRAGLAVNELLAVGVIPLPYSEDPLGDVWADQSFTAVPGYFEGDAQVGARLTEAVYGAGVRVLLETSVTGILESDGVVSGVSATRSKGESFEINAENVVIATGGYTRDTELVERYLPQCKGVLSIFNDGNMGEAIGWVEGIGGALHDMDEMPGFLTYDESGKNLPFYAGDFSLIVDSSGNRFCSEGDGSYADYVSVGQIAVSQYEDPTIYYLMDQGLYDMYPGKAELESSLRLGHAKKFGTLSEVVDEYGLVDLEASVDRYNEMAVAGIDSDFGRVANLQPFSKEGPYWVMRGKPGIYGVFGGISVDFNFSVIDEEGNPIPGLYAIGQAIGSAPLMEGAAAADMGLSANLASGWIVGNDLAGVYVGGSYTGSAPYGEDQVVVSLEVDESRKVTHAEVVLASSGETPETLSPAAQEIVDTQGVPAFAGTDEEAASACAEALIEALCKADLFL